MSVYTRTGDEGMTSNFLGKRIPKCHVLIETYGAIDELNAHIGLVVSLLQANTAQDFLREIQKDLFVIGSSFLDSTVDFRVISPRVREMENRIDAMEKLLPELHTFILPGGSTIGAQIHVTRSIARRIERQIVALLTHTHPDVDIEKHHGQSIVTYVNRLSDFLFVLARFINAEEKIAEIPWQGLPKKGK